MQQRVSIVVACVLLGIGMLVTPGGAVDPILLEAQRTLSDLGYDPGMADGIYGPRTRQALEAFQRQAKVPVNGILDAATLQALEQATSTAVDPPTSELQLPNAPLRVVLHYLRLYAYQPSRVLPYVTEGFLQGLTPQEWIEQTMQTRHGQEPVYLSWQVQRLEMADAQATVEVSTRVRLQGQEQVRREVFTLLYTASAGWLVDSWLVEAAAAAKPLSPTGS